MSEVLIALLIFSIAVNSALLALNTILTTERQMSWHEQALSLVEHASQEAILGKMGFVPVWRSQVKQDLPDGVGKVSSSANGQQIEVNWLGGSKLLRTVVLKEKDQ